MEVILSILQRNLSLHLPSPAALALWEMDWILPLVPNKGIQVSVFSVFVT